MNLLGAPYLRLTWRTPALRRAVLVCGSLGLLGAIAEIAVALSLVPILGSLGIDAGQKAGNLFDAVPPGAWLAAFALAAAFRSLVNWQGTLWMNRAAQAVTVSLQSRLFRALADAHWHTVRLLSPPTIANALHTQAYGAGHGLSQLIQVLVSSVLVLGYLVSAAAVYPLLLPALLVLMVFIWRVYARRGNRIWTMAEDYRESQTSLHQLYEDWIAIGRIAPLGAEAGELTARFDAEARQAAALALGFAQSTALTRVGYEMAVVAGMLVGVPLAWHLETPPALLVFGLVVLVRVLPRAGGIHVAYQHVVGASAPLRAVEQLAEQLEADRITRSTADGQLQWQRLQLTDVGVSNPTQDNSDARILSDITLEVAAGSCFGITGATGAGKTTLVEVMLGLVRPDHGALLVDDRRMDEPLAARWRSQSAYVPQDVVLFDGSIRDNLCLHAPDVSDTALLAALDTAEAGFVMQRLPDGLDTRVGPGGRWLSGGERQRIGIARALLGKPGFLVLDEPTAALDFATEARLIERLASLRGSVTLVLITHRPALLALADRMAHLQQGRLVEP